MVSLSQESIDEFRARTALETALSQLDSSWLILVDLRINGPTDATAADYVALHPRRGIALIDVILSRTGDPAQRLRKFLDGERFSARFPGNLPIVRLVLKPTEASMFGRRVHAAFGDVPPITIADPGWMAAVNELLVPGDGSGPLSVPPLFKRSALRSGAGPQKLGDRVRQSAKPASRPDDTRATTSTADESWGVTPDRWPDKMAGATPFRRSERPASSGRPANPAPPPPRPPSRPQASASERAPAGPLPPRPGSQAAPKRESAAPAAPKRESAPPPTIEPAVPFEKTPLPRNDAMSPSREVPVGPEESPAAAQNPLPHDELPHDDRPLDEQSMAERGAWWAVEPAEDGADGGAGDERAVRSASDAETAEAESRGPETRGPETRGPEFDDRPPEPESTSANVIGAGQPIKSLVQFPPLRRSGAQSGTTARKDIDSDDADDGDTPSIMAPIVRLVTRQRDRIPRPGSLPPEHAMSPDAEPVLEPRDESDDRLSYDGLSYEERDRSYDERDRVAFGRGLTARRDDGLTGPPPATRSWRGHAVAALVLVALLGGGIAWFSSGGSTDEQVASLPAASTATPLPAAPPVADAGSAGSTPTAQGGPSANANSTDSTSSTTASTPAAAPTRDAASTNPNSSGSTSSATRSTPAAPPTPATRDTSSSNANSTGSTSPTPPSTPAAAPVPVPVPPPAAPAMPPAAEPSVASIAPPPPVAPPLPKAKPTPPTVSENGPPAGPPKADTAEPPAPQAPPAPPATPSEVARAPEPPAAQPAPEAKVNPPRELAEKPAPPARVARIAAAARTKARTTDKTPTDKAEGPEDRSAPAALSTELARKLPGLRETAPRAPREVVSSQPPGRTAAPREPHGGPPIDLADLPPGETVSPSPSPAPVEQQPSASAPTLASAAAARMHGPTSLLPPSPNGTPAAAQSGSTEVCRSYTSMKTLLGQPRQVSGLACRDASGQWQIITELPD